jgi:hypothetical protein
LTRELENLVRENGALVSRVKSLNAPELVEVIEPVHVVERPVHVVERPVHHVHQIERPVHVVERPVHHVHQVERPVHVQYEQPR